MDTFSLHEEAMHVDGQTIGYLEAGPIDGPLIVFVHGWPELGRSWRKLLPVFAGLGFRVAAPDLRGFGRSGVPTRHEDYAQELIVGDMIGLLDGLGHDRAVWVGHDWGAPVVWNIASHHPGRCFAVAGLSVPYRTVECGLDAVLALIDRAVYPADRGPVGPWDYVYYDQENFDRAVAVLGADPYRTLKALFRRGNPASVGQPGSTASMRASGGWFGGRDAAPDLPADTAIASEEELHIYAESLECTGFFGPVSLYMNDEANARYAAQALDGGRLTLPVLFIAGRYENVCEAVRSPLAGPMRELCSELREVVIDAGHWLAQERPTEVSAQLARWIATSVPEAWPS